MTATQAVILGLIQGIAEWLPVSSSAHLKIAQRLLGVSEGGGGLAFTLFLHLATLLVGLWAFRRDLLRLATTHRRQAVWLVLATIPAACAGKLFNDRIEAQFDSTLFTGSALMVTGGVLLAAHWFASGSRAVGEEYEAVHGAYPKGLPPPVGTKVKTEPREIPSHLAALAGIDPEEDEDVPAEEAPDAPPARRAPAGEAPDAPLARHAPAGEAPDAPPTRRAPVQDVGRGAQAPQRGLPLDGDSDPIPEIADGPWPTPAQALAIGFAQTAALLPGISRSGSTLSAGLFSGVRRSQAVPYAFLLGLPITAGAILSKARDCAQSPVTIEPISWIVGFIVAAGMSLVVVGPALRFLARSGLGIVGGYCILAGGAVCGASMAGIL